MLVFPNAEASPYARALLSALLLLGVADCSRAPRLPYDMTGLEAHDPCGEPVPADCLIPTPTLPYDASALRFGIITPTTSACASSGLRLVVSLPEQRLFAYRGDVLVATSPVSTGKPGHATPVGVFHISQKQVFHRSNRYSNAPMPYMERLTASGVALHAGQLPGYPASHGCIRLPMAFARRLYRMTSYGTPVTVTKTRVAPAGRGHRQHPIPATSNRGRART
jgi:hypothetical protein